jgi:hypothetical protein
VSDKALTDAQRATLEKIYLDLSTKHCDADSARAAERIHLDFRKHITPAVEQIVREAVEAERKRIENTLDMMETRAVDNGCPRALSEWAKSVLAHQPETNDGK